MSATPGGTNWLPVVSAPSQALPPPTPLANAPAPAPAAPAAAAAAAAAVVVPIPASEQKAPSKHAPLESSARSHNRDKHAKPRRSSYKKVHSDSGRRHHRHHRRRRADSEDSDSSVDLEHDNCWYTAFCCCLCHERNCCNLPVTGTWSSDHCCCLNKRQDCGLCGNVVCSCRLSRRSAAWCSAAFCWAFAIFMLVLVVGATVVYRDRASHGIRMSVCLSTTQNATTRDPSTGLLRTGPATTLVFTGTGEDDQSLVESLLFPEPTQLQLTVALPPSADGALAPSVSFESPEQILWAVQPAATSENGHAVLRYCNSTSVVVLAQHLNTTTTASQLAVTVAQSVLPNTGVLVLAP